MNPDDDNPPPPIAPAWVALVIVLDIAGILAIAAIIVWAVAR